ncbi:MAG: ferredoxin [Actinobacteria bacterium]|nr:ferredoxin [Actinomycetota bacterium]
MRIIADYDACEANARCVEILPEVFHVDDNDFLHLKDENPPEELRAKVEAAVMACPKAALSLED